MSAENYHLTLAFLGEQPAALLPAIIEAGASLEVPTGEMRLSCLGYFERARVLWLGPENTPNPLRLHVRRLWQALAPLGIARERRPFAAHLTLARKVNRAPSVAVRPVRWRYAGFALVESVTQVQGARYRVIAGWPLVVGADAERME